MIHLNPFTRKRPCKKAENAGVKIIAVIGAIGSGKSQFINEISGSNLQVSDALGACTNHVAFGEQFPLAGHTVKLLDTPGFSITDKHDARGNEAVIRFLNEECGGGKKLHGIVYLHRISDPRAGTVPRNSLRVFRELCDGGDLKNVIIVTTMWGNLKDEEEGRAREDEMKNNDLVFKSCLDNGAKLMRYGDSRESGYQILSTLFNDAQALDRVCILDSLRVEDIYREIDKRHAQEKEKLTALYIESLRQLEEKRKEEYLRYNLPPPCGNGCIRLHEHPQSNSSNLELPEGDYERLIAVMGPTGSGKSTFINLFNPPESQVDVSNSLESCTREVRMGEPFELDGHQVRLIDTPGFDDTYLSDADILKSIGGFLAAQYGRGDILQGIIYLHRISDVRMGGISVQAFRLFKALCGNESLKNVAITTTMWESVPPELGEAREIELETNETFFQPAIREGARMLRHSNTRSSAEDILRSLFQHVRTPLIIQREVHDEKIPIEDTQAGREVFRHYRELLEKHEKQIAELKADLMLVTRDRDEKARKELEREKHGLEGDMDRMTHDMAHISLGFRQEMERQAERYQGTLNIDL